VWRSQPAGSEPVEEWAAWAGSWGAHGLPEWHARHERHERRERRWGMTWAARARAQWTYGLACIPLLPLLATPVPNLPLYYCGYKARRPAGAQAAGGLLWPR